MKNIQILTLFYINTKAIIKANKIALWEIVVFIVQPYHVQTRFASQKAVLH